MSFEIYKLHNIPENMHLVADSNSKIMCVIDNLFIGIYNHTDKQTHGHCDY